MDCLWNTDNMQLYFYPWELMFHFYQHLKTRLDEYRDRCIWVLQLLTQKSIQHSSNASLMQCGVVTLLKLLRWLILQWWVIFVMIFFEGKWRMQHSKTKPALLLQKEAGVEKQYDVYSWTTLHFHQRETENYSGTGNFTSI